MLKDHVRLSPSVQKKLQSLQDKGSLKARQYKRIQGLLELNKGKTYVEVCDLVGVSYPTVLSWANKYQSEGLNFLEDKPRSGRPEGLSGEDRAKITALACTDPPAGYARWSLRLLADRLVELEIVDSISFRQVGNILKKMNFSLTENDNGVSEK